MIRFSINLLLFVFVTFDVLGTGIPSGSESPFIVVCPHTDVKIQSCLPPIPAILNNNLPDNTLDQDWFNAIDGQSDIGSSCNGPVTVKAGFGTLLNTPADCNDIAIYQRTITVYDGPPGSITPSQDCVVTYEVDNPFYILRDISISLPVPPTIVQCSDDVDAEYQKFLDNLGYTVYDEGCALPITENTSHPRWQPLPTTIRYLESPENPNGCGTSLNPGNGYLSYAFYVIDACGHEMSTIAEFIVIDDVPPVITNCPADLTLDLTLGQADIDKLITDHLDTATASDNCNPDPDISNTYLPTTIDYNACNEEDYEIFIMANDDCDNNVPVSCMTKITITNSGGIVMDCPDVPLNLECGDPLNENTVDNWFATVRAEDFGGLQLQDITNNFDKSNLNNPNCPSSINVTFIATDNRCMRTETCTQFINIDDTIPPVTMGCPANMSINADSPTLVADVNDWLNQFTATDQCNTGNITSNDFDQNIINGTNCGSRTVDIQFVADDLCNPADSSCVATLDIIDNIVSEFSTFPPDTTIECSTSPNTAELQAWINQAVAGNNLGQSFTVQSDLDFFNPLFSECGAEIEVTIFFLDQCDIPIERIARIFISDNIAPTITCPADATFDADLSPDIEADIIGWIGSATVNDNCGTNNLQPTFNDYFSGAFAGCDEEITNTITFNVSDKCGNMSPICTSQLTLRTEKTPLISCPPDLILECGDTTNQDQLIAWLDRPLATSVLGDTLIDQTDFDISSLDLISCLNNQEVRFFVSESCAPGMFLESECFSNIRISDTTPPTLTCPGALTLNTTGTDNNALVDDWLATVEFGDNGCLDPILTTDYDDNIDFCAQSGAMNVTFNVQDQCGLMALGCVGRITFNSSLPQANCPPANFVLECGDADNETFIQDYLALATAMDNSGVDLSISNNYDPATLPTTGCNESVLVEFLTMDDCGQVNSCQVSIAILDTQAPEYIDDCATLSLSLLSGTPIENKKLSFQNWLDGIAITDCNAFTLTHDFDPETFTVDCDDITIPIIISLEDECGWIAPQCASQIIITNNIDATITCAQDFTVECGDMDNEQLIRDWLDTATANDNLGNSFDVNDDFDFNNPDLFQCMSAIVVNFEMVNICGATESCMANLNVIDNTDPEAICPDPISLVLESTTFDTDVTNWLNTVSGTDACISSLNYVNTYTPINSIPPCTASEDYSINFRALDGCGNSDECMAVLTVTTDKVPRINCPDNDLMLECADADNDNLISSWLQTTNGTDADGGFLMVTENYNSADLTAINCNGTIEVEFSITDGCNITEVCSKQIIVEDTTPPTAVCPTDLTINSSNPDGVGLAKAWMESNGALDDCSIATASVDVAFLIPTVLCNMTEINEVDFFAEDECGLTDACTATLTINQALPEISCPDDIQLQCGASTNQDEIDAWLVAFSGTDNNGNDLVVTDNFSNTNLPNDCESSVEFEFKVSDNCGKESVCLQSIVQRDTIAPIIINCPTALELNVETADLNDQISVWLTSFDAMDNCNNADIALTNDYNLEIEEFDCGDTQDVTFQAEDRCGNIDATCIVNINIFNELRPEISCPEDIIVKCNEGDLEFQINEFLLDFIPMSLDSAGVTTDFDFSAVDTECSGAFTQEVIFTITDRCGNSDECSAFIEFIPAAAVYIPTIFNPSGTGEDRFFSIRSNVAVETITSFRIYSRWGDLMFERKNFNPNQEEGWNGRDNFGNNVQGVYAYVIEYEDIFENPFRHEGTLTLIE